MMIRHTTRREGYPRQQISCLSHEEDRQIQMHGLWREKPAGQLSPHPILQVGQKARRAETARNGHRSLPVHVRCVVRCCVPTISPYVSSLYRACISHPLSYDDELEQRISSPKILIILQDACYMIPARAIARHTNCFQRYVQQSKRHRYTVRGSEVVNLQFD